MSYHFEHLTPEVQQRLLKVCTNLGNFESLDHYLNEIANTSIELTDSQFAAIFILDHLTGNLLLTATSPTQFSSKYSLPPKSIVTAEILEAKRPLIVIAKDDDEEYFSRIAPNQPEKTWNLMALPVKFRQRISGILIVMNKRSKLPFGERDIEINQILASQVALAVAYWSLFQQTDLIADFMHELKTPMMALTAAGELLAREELANKQSELVEMIQKETMRLSKIAQDFLDLARLDSGRVVFAHESVDFEKLISDVARLQRPQAEVRNISIETSIGDIIPQLIGDPERLKRVLINLTSNAIKYNVDGGRVRIAASSGDRNVIVEVSDTGPGIPEEDLPHIFERFYRLADSEGFTEGTGLGLPISARIVQEHGGHIEVDSEINKGSTFRCIFPISGN